MNPENLAGQQIPTSFDADMAAKRAQLPSNNYKVIQADYGLRVKAIGVLDRSTDPIEWVNAWFKNQDLEPGNRPGAIYITEFENLDGPSVLGSTMVHVVSYMDYVGSIERA